MAVQTTIQGNLTADPELRYTASGKAVLKLRIGATYTRLNKDTNQYEDVGEPLFLDATFWERTAERITEMNLSKGTRIALTGILTKREYKNQVGALQTALEITNARLLGVIPKTNTTQHANNGNQWPAPQQATYNQPPGGTATDPWSSGQDDEPPF